MEHGYLWLFLDLIDDSKRSEYKKFLKKIKQNIPEQLLQPNNVSLQLIPVMTKAEKTHLRNLKHGKSFFTGYYSE